MYNFEILRETTRRDIYSIILFTFYIIIYHKITDNLMIELMNFAALTFHLSVYKHFQVCFTKSSLSKRLHGFRGKTRWQQVGRMEYRQ